MASKNEMRYCRSCGNRCYGRQCQQCFTKHKRNPARLVPAKDRKKIYWAQRLPELVDEIAKKVWRELK